ncbi:hypothetical protein [Marinirhabdus gelatinilytica]|uniref:Uncharacterized protein n=1 Tax=Marinirhabdus gelatinilytica TaxID=1703343 RepID=A0A370QAZ5_9FLAO|nr:hypothetical protein [Marinirhabdus gelatinilytica]RDK85545.1 hypothetical protein C8D94_103372 [Marinirhabdus gelatinilytica]
MKTFVTLFFVLSVFQFSISQETTEVPQDSALEAAVEKIVENEYVRIPKKDFDSIIENRIANEVNDKFNFLIAILGGVFGVLSIFSLVQTNRSKNMLKEHIEAQMGAFKNETKMALEESVNSTIDSKMDQLNLKMENEDIKIKKELEEVRGEVELKLQSVEFKNEQTVNQVARAEEYITNIEIDDLEAKLKKNELVYGIEEQTTKLLEEIHQSEKHKKRLPLLLSHFVSYLYNRNKNESDTVLLSLIEKYEKSNELHYSTYVNGGLTAFNKYLRYGSARKERERALQYLDKSLDIQDTYGVALALKLQIFMIDLKRAIDEESRKKAIHNAKKVIVDIVTSASMAPSYETVYRFAKDYKMPQQREFIDALSTYFEPQLREMLDKANKHAAKLKAKPFQLSDFTPIPPEDSKGIPGATETKDSDT